MNKDVIKEWLEDISTPTGLSYSGDLTLSNSMVDKIGEYIEEIEQENQQLKKQKNDVIDYIKSLQICTLGYSKTLITEIIINILRMLGEIDNE